MARHRVNVSLDARTALWLDTVARRMGVSLAAAGAACIRLLHDLAAEPSRAPTDLLDDTARHITETFDRLAHHERQPHDEP